MNRQLFGSNMLNNLKILNGFGVVDDAYYKCPLCMQGKRIKLFTF